jgi:hypothetical protein
MFARIHGRTERHVLEPLHRGSGRPGRRRPFLRPAAAHLRNHAAGQAVHILQIDLVLDKPVHEKTVEPVAAQVALTVKAEQRLIDMQLLQFNGQRQAVLQHRLAVRDLGSMLQEHIAHCRPGRGAAHGGPQPVSRQGHHGLAVDDGFVQMLPHLLPLLVSERPEPERPQVKLELHCGLDRWIRRSGRRGPAAEQLARHLGRIRLGGLDGCSRRRLCRPRTTGAGP